MQNTPGQEETTSLNTAEITNIISGSFANSSKNNGQEYPQINVKKRVVDLDAETIYTSIQRYKIEDVNLSNLQKLHERELINVPFFQKLRKVFNPQMIKSHLMETLGISKSYTGFHEYMKGEREDIPNAGLCNIAKKVGYNVMVIPVPENITEAEYKALCSYRDSFIQAVDKRIKEGNVPVTRARSMAKEKEKYVNTSLLDGLALDSEQILDSINPSNVTDDEKISADAVFQDSAGPLDFETIAPVVQQMDVNNLNFSTSLGQVGSMDTFTGGTIMTGFDDSFSDFKHIGEFDEFDGEEFPEEE